MPSTGSSVRRTKPPTPWRFSPDDWTRTAVFDFGDREVIDMARNMVHEGSHHLRDIERVLRSVIGKPLPTDDEDD